MPERVYQRFDDEQISLVELASASAAATSLARKRKRPSRPESAGHDAVNKPVALYPRSRSNNADLSINRSQSSRHAEPNLRARAAALESARKTLPIWAHVSEISQALRDKDVLLIVGETGSGKSTQVPQMLVEEPWCQSRKVVVPSEKSDHESEEAQLGQNDPDSIAKTKECTQSVKVGGCIAITEPRKVAAISLADRVAKEMGTPLGSSSPASKVGFSVRFNQSVSPSTQIKFLTEGMLLQEMLRDPWLRNYSAVVLDEVHERGLNVDLLLGFLRQMVSGRCEGRGGVPLKVAIMSATAEMEGLKAFFEEGYEHSRGYGSRISDGSGGQNGIDKIHDDDESIDEQQDEESEWSGILSSSDENGRASVSSEDTGSPDDDTGKPLDRRKFEETTALEFPSNPANGSYAKNPPPKANGRTRQAHEAREDNECPVATCYVSGRQYPVTIHYTEKPVQNWLDATLRQIFLIHYKEPLPGDILVFLTGQETVESLEKLILEQEKSLPPNVPKFLTLPLFAALPQDAQQAVFHPPPPNTRKLILATNIAETSVTVPGVRFVIDCGKAKTKHFRTRIGLESLLVKPISKSAATQRMGRAGREAPGQCWRLYTETDYLTLQQNNTPEILRCDLSQAILTMQARGIHDIYHFPFLDRPRRDAYEKALAHLYQLGALNDSGAITPLGTQMATLPLSPSLARTLLAATEPGADCLAEVIDIIACLSVETIFLKTTSEEKKEEAETARRTLHRREGDHLTLLATVQTYLRENADRREWCRRCWVSHRAMKAVMDVRKQLRSQRAFAKLLPPSPLPPSSSSAPPSTSLPPPPSTSPPPPPPSPSSAPQPASSTDLAPSILHCFLKGFASNTALRQPDGSYKTLVGGQKVAVHPGSVMFGKRAEAIVFDEFVFTTRAYARGVSAVEVGWLRWGEGEGGVGRGEG